MNVYLTFHSKAKVPLIEWNFMVSFPVTVSHESAAALFRVNGFFCNLEESMEFLHFQHVISIGVKMCELPEQKMDFTHAAWLTYKRLYSKIENMSTKGSSIVSAVRFKMECHLH